MKMKILLAVFIIFVVYFSFSVLAIGCPVEKSVTITGKGSGESPITIYAGVGTGSTVLQTPSEARADAEENAVSACDSDLQANLATASAECLAYCSVVQGCTATSSIDGPNSCDSDNASCKQTTRKAGKMMDRVKKVIGRIPALKPLNKLLTGSSNVVAMSCEVKASTTYTCTCNEGI